MENLDNMRLPKINLRKQQSRVMQNLLESKIQQSIIDLEKENNYKFESYEVDNVLLDMIKNNHRSYLISQFGYDTE